MFADPLVLPAVAPTGATLSAAFTGAGSSTLSFICTGRGPTSSTYRHTIDTSHFIDLFIGRQVAKQGRTRFTARFTESELVPDVVNSALNSKKTSSIYIVADIGVLGQGTNWAKMLHGLSRFIYLPTGDYQLLDDVTFDLST